ncbi:MAG TPA: DUF1343 domain-containing protein [Chitinophagaceae bacterium]|jgi:uncharacterized protein YbbC (DUF1343 family)|nr:DUF1343 domain-containing protein [Chitinophagaceae bacterium]
MKKIGLQLIVLSICFVFLNSAKAQESSKIIPAADRTSTYLPLLKGKRIGVFANHTSVVGNTHLVDFLLANNIQVTKAFGPEHGFRGKADAGEKIENYIDSATGIPVISLYGKKRRPSAEDLADVDIMLFDIQDVGVRFYTFISSLEEYMNAAFENKKPLILLDRPNPNGYYIDGPVLEMEYKSFIGMKPVPIVYGMTIGEYALMLAGEKWLTPKANEQAAYYKNAENSADTAFHFLVIKCANYTHKSLYNLPVKPSPNLPDIQSIYWYPTTCFFEGTVLSEGRGTDHPFCIFGHPSITTKNAYSFTPTSRDGAKEPKLKNQLCYGWNLYNDNANTVKKKVNCKIQIGYLIDAYKAFPNKEKFFLQPKSGKPTDFFFNKLAGNSQLMQQIIDEKSETEIRESWKEKLDAFKQIRKNYLLYEDF